MAYIPCIASANIFQIASLSPVDRLEARTISTCKLLVEFVFTHAQVSDRRSVKGGNGLTPRSDGILLDHQGK
jgi:hypothetical protein